VASGSLVGPSVSPGSVTASIATTDLMNIVRGSRLGPYEVEAPLGAGGMGEVWRARDTRLARPVAIKVLPAEVSTDPERLARFRNEARAASALNHPSIVTIHDVAQEQGAAYLVMELVEGRTLRELLADGPPPLRRTLQIATEIAEGLAMAHAAGIVHRDLKPENVMVTADGRVKILDFGLAKVTAPAPGGTSVPSDSATLIAPTNPGVVLGTAGYMSPEQASGRPVDFRSDQFALGTILYELIAGRRAFGGNSVPEMLTAIIREEPPSLAELAPRTPLPVRWIVDRCLAKEPRERYASTEDLARELANVLHHLSEVRAAADTIAGRPAALERRWRLAAIAVAVCAAAGLVAGWALLRRGAALPPEVHQLTFRHGRIRSARFAPDGRTAVYAASWEGQPSEAYTAQPESSESRPLGLPAYGIADVSRTGELAILELGKSNSFTLSRVPLSGGAAPRQVLENAAGAAWAPDGTLAAIHGAGGKTILEYPIGKALTESPVRLWAIRFSPDGARIAFLSYASGFLPSRGELCTVDLAGKRTVVAADLPRPSSLAWHPTTGEIWVAASGGKGATDIVAFTLSGRRRLVTRLAGRFTLEALSPAGDLLLLSHQRRGVVLAKGAGEEKERDLSWLEATHVMDVSPDGKSVLLLEGGDGGGEKGSIYLRRIDGSPAVRLGDGIASGFSADGSWVITMPEQGRFPLTLMPTGPGQPRTLPAPDLASVAWANATPDGKRIVFSAYDKAGRGRLYVQDIAGGAARGFSPPDVLLAYGNGVSPDGTLVAALDNAADLTVLVPIDGGPVRALPGVEKREIPLRWSPDGRSVFVYRRGDVPARLFKLDASTGTRTLWKEIAPADPAGVATYDGIFLNADVTSYAYCFDRDLTDLFLVQGLR